MAANSLDIRARRALAAAAAIAALCVGCHGEPPRQEPVPDSDVTFRWADGIYGFGSNGAIEAGMFGYHFGVAVYRLEPRLARFSLDGPGALFQAVWAGSGDAYRLVPTHPSVEYERPGFGFLYRPPPNDQVPPEDTAATVSVEVLNPHTGNWVRSPGYRISVAHRDAPIDAYFLPSAWNEGWGKYYHYLEAYPDDLFARAEIAAGGTYGSFYFCTAPRPSEELDMRFRLDAPAGYAGERGSLTAKSNRYPFDGYVSLGYRDNGENWTLSYTAPDHVEEPVDITAVLSIHDPWAGGRREFGLVFRVSPR